MVVVHPAMPYFCTTQCIQKISYNVSATRCEYFIENKKKVTNTHSKRSKESKYVLKKYNVDRLADKFTLEANIPVLASYKRNDSVGLLLHRPIQSNTIQLHIYKS